MLTVKIFDEKDFKQFEDMMTRVIETSLRKAMARAIVTAVRVLQRENLIPGHIPVPPPHQPELTPEEIAETAAPPAPADAKPKKQQQRSLKELLPTCADRPSGFITREEATKLIGGDQAAQSSISNWLYGKKLQGWIVANIKPPSKGCPGKICVNREQLLALNRQRQHNVMTLPQLKIRARAAAGV